MKSYFHSFLILIFSTGCALQQEQPKESKLSVSVADQVLDQKDHSIKIVPHLILKNLSSDSIGFFSLGGEGPANVTAEFKFRDAKGVLVQETSVTPRFSTLFFGRTFLNRISSGQSFSWDARDAYTYMILKPGRYSITAHVHVADIDEVGDDIAGKGHDLDSGITRFSVR